MYGIPTTEFKVVEVVAYIYRRYLETVVDNQAIDTNRWFYVYKTHLEEFTINHVEFLTVLAVLGYIEILQEDLNYKLRIRFNEAFIMNPQIISKKNLVKKEQEKIKKSHGRK